MGVFINIIGEGKLKGHQINGSLPLGNIMVHLTLPQLIPHFGTLHWQLKNFGLPYRIWMRFGTQSHETYQEGTPFVPCQSNMFKIENVRVKVLGQFKSHNPQNPIKLIDNNLNILGSMLLDLLNILGHSPCENKLIKEVKNHNPKLG